MPRRQAPRVAKSTTVRAKKSKPIRKKAMIKSGANAKPKAAKKPTAARKAPVPFVSTGYWLMKSEPESYSIDALARDGKSLWTGVRNYQARNFMTVSMKPGEKAIFYHSNAEPSAAVGIMTIARTNLPDVSALDSTSDYYDAKASHDHPIWFCCEVEFDRKLARAVTLDELRTEPALKEMQLLRPGQRLSILPLTKAEYEKILAMSGAK